MSVVAACQTGSVGGPRRSVLLRVIGGSVELRDDVPATRAECPTTRPCGHIRCKEHLWLVVGPDRPGRRHPGERDRTSMLRPVWLQWPVPPSCYLDELERAIREDWSVTKMALALGVRSSGFRYLLAKARRKYRASGGALREFVGDDETLPAILDDEEP